ncbi:TetR/AcrR family transcriptional regulator [Streptomyces sp. ISL-43]|uniref:TetR/AcrR family transcriptional regulator n=1 Tax=Streptomyces sp. ISL-43 TaxID=2819183 RepID=UPI001BEBF2A4|nr:TetR/AcrR family transcriptional regulator [Streptomyces sp. ISL-43]MBT2447924.1 TetR/AcrR family transcriptional regulator [Streptomyces sp. ISL-43]
MAQQERAERTRRALINGAAKAIDLYGYEGASLAVICTAAGVTKGALMYHFPAKDDLVRAVRSEARQTTAAALDSVPRAGVRPLQAAVDMTHVVAGRLGHDPVARAGARLTREFPHYPDAGGSWTEPVRAELAAALHGAADPREIAAQVVFSLIGMDVALRAEEPRPSRSCGPLRRHVTRLWRLILPGIVAGPHIAELYRAEGSSPSCAFGSVPEAVIPGRRR